MLVIKGTAYIGIVPLASVGVTLRSPFVETAVGCRFVLVEGVMVSIQHLHPAGNLLHRAFDIEFHLRFAFLPFAGGDDDYAVGTTRAVDSSSRSVLEHLNLLNVVGVDHREGVLRGILSVVGSG